MFFHTKKNGILACAVFMLVALFLMFEMGLQMAPSVMTSEVMADLHMSAKALGAAMGVYFLGYSVMQIPAGMLFDRFSARVIVAIVTAICALGAWCYGHAESAWSLGASRMLMGSASAFAFVALLTMAYRWFSQRYYALLVGVTQFMAALGAVFGTEPLAEALSSMTWRAAFDQLAFFGLGLAVIILAFVRSSPKGEAVHKQAHAMTVSESFKEVVSNKQSWWLFVYAFLIWGPVTVFSALWGTAYLSTLYHITTAQAAVFSWYFWLPTAIASPIVGYWSDYMGARGPLMRWTAALGVVATAAMIGLHEISMPMMKCLLVLFGIAASGQILSFAVVTDVHRPGVVATATGMNNMGVVLGGLILQPLVGALLDWFGPETIADGTPIYSLTSYKVALLVMPLCFIFGFVVAKWGIKETHCHSLHEHD
jgi:MFS family permease